MIKSVELKENNFYLLIDFENKKIMNNENIKVVNLEKLNRIEDFLKNYLLYWDHLYINNNVYRNHTTFCILFEYSSFFTMIMKVRLS